MVGGSQASTGGLAKARGGDQGPNFQGFFFPPQRL